MHYSTLTAAAMMAIFSSVAGFPTDAGTADLAKRGGSYYSFYFFTDNSKKTATGTISNGDHTNKCQQVPANTGDLFAEIHNLCIDVFTDANCQTKHASLTSGDGHCHSYGKGWLNYISSDSTGVDGAGMGQPFGGGSFAAFGSYVTGDKRSVGEGALQERGAGLGWASWRASIP